MISKNISQFGVELEGAWIPGHGSGEVKGDGSVYFREEDGELFILDDCIIGEIALPPFDDLDTLRERLRADWPEHFNLSCGMHIHMELSSLGWMVFGNRLGHDLFVSKAKTFARDKYDNGDSEYGAVLDRLDGENEYCRGHFCVDKALINAADGRYYIFNGASYQRHNTLELRVWPQLNLQHGLELIDFTAMTVEEVIKDVGKLEDLIWDPHLEKNSELTEGKVIPSFKEVRAKKLDVMRLSPSESGVNPPPPEDTFSTRVQEMLAANIRSSDTEWSDIDSYRSNA